MLIFYLNQQQHQETPRNTNQMATTKAAPEVGLFSLLCCSFAIERNDFFLYSKKSKEKKIIQL